MANTNRARIWVTWEDQLRNKSLSNYVNADYYEFSTYKNRYIKYFINSFKTLSLYSRIKPEIIFSQNPSLLLALITVIYCKLFKNIISVIDAHNAGLFPLEGNSRILNCIADFILKHASITIVSNKYLAKYVVSKNGRAVVIPDPLPDFSKYNYLNKNYDGTKSKAIVFICSWQLDEPYLEVIQAAKLLSGFVTIYITGNSAGKEKVIKRGLPSNVILTGYISINEYIKLLCLSDGVIDLTTRDNCLVCGAYEAVELEKPMILSDKEVIKEYFYKGAIYTKNTDVEISKAIVELYEKLEFLNKQIKELKTEIQRSWFSHLNNLEHELLILKTHKVKS